MLDESSACGGDEYEIYWWFLVDYRYVYARNARRFCKFLVIVTSCGKIVHFIVNC